MSTTLLMFDVDGDGMMLECRILQSGDAFFHQWVCGKKKKKDRLTVDGIVITKITTHTE